MSVHISMLVGMWVCLCVFFPSFRCRERIETRATTTWLLKRFRERYILLYSFYNNIQSDSPSIIDSPTPPHFYFDNACVQILGFRTLKYIIYYTKIPYFQRVKIFFTAFKECLVAIQTYSFFQMESLFFNVNYLIVKLFDVPKLKFKRVISELLNILSKEQYCPSVQDNGFE